MQPEGEFTPKQTQPNPNKTKQNQTNFLGYAWWNRGFSKACAGKKEKKFPQPKLARQVVVKAPARLLQGPSSLAWPLFSCMALLSPPAVGRREDFPTNRSIPRMQGLAKNLLARMGWVLKELAGPFPG
jgi:hypothetical protein